MKEFRSWEGMVDVEPVKIGDVWRNSDSDIYAVITKIEVGSHPVVACDPTQVNAWVWYTVFRIDGDGIVRWVRTAGGQHPLTDLTNTYELHTAGIINSETSS